MEHRSLEYSPHAFGRLHGLHLSKDETEAIVRNPMKRNVSHSAVEHHGCSDEGRELIVVTDRSEPFVITVIDKNRRRETRREKDLRRIRRRRNR